MKRHKPGFKSKISDDDIISVLKNMDIFLDPKKTTLRSELDDIWKDVTEKLIQMNGGEINIHSLRERIRQNRNDILEKVCIAKCNENFFFRILP